MPYKNFNVGLRDVAEGAGYNVDWSKERGVNINNQSFDTTGWHLRDGRYYGTQDMADTMLQSYRNPQEAQPFADYSIGLRDTLENSGYKVGWDPARGVSVDNKPYDTTGWQLINDRYKGNQAMVDQLNTQFPKKGMYEIPGVNDIRGVESVATQTPTEIGTPKPGQEWTAPIYDPKYLNKIEEINMKVDEAIKGFGSQYDLASDPVYKQLADYQEGRMLQMANRRGLAMDSNTKAKIDQAGRMLGVEFQDRHENRQIQNLQNLQSQINNLGTLEEQNYRRFTDQYGMDTDAIKLGWDSQTQEARMRDSNMASDVATYGMPLTDVTRGYMNMLGNLTLEQRQYVDQYKDDYAAIINQLPDGDPSRQIFEAARFQKVLGDPETYRDYLINDYGISNTYVDGVIMNKKIAEAQALATNEKEAIELEKLRLSYEKAFYDTQSASYGVSKSEADSRRANLDAFMKSIDAANLPNKTKLELQGLAARLDTSILANEINKDKLKTMIAGKSPKVSAGFTEFVEFAKEGTTSEKAMQDWLRKETQVTVKDESGMPRTYVAPNSFIYSPDELKEIMDLGKKSGIIKDINQNIFSVLNSGNIPSRDEAEGGN